MCLHLVREIDFFFLYCILIYEGERPIFQKRGEKFLRKKERREKRGIKKSERK
jgi:hypothetical protein